MGWMTYEISWQYGLYYGKSATSLQITKDDTMSIVELLDWQSFWLFEGNYGCDCGRNDLIHNDNSPWLVYCGEDIIFHDVKFYYNHYYIGRGDDNGWFVL